MGINNHNNGRVVLWQKQNKGRDEMIGLFTGIWSKLAAGFALLSAAFLLFIKWQSGKIKRLNHENKTLDKKNEIKAEAAINKEKVLADEDKAILKLKAEAMKHDKKLGLDFINKL